MSLGGQLETFETASPIVSRGEGFFKAKVEHYLMRAEEMIQSARYLPAKETVETVLSLDPENAAGKSLAKRIEYLLETIIHRDSKTSGPGNGNGFTWSRPRRDELVMVVDQDERLVEALVASLRRYGLNFIAASSHDEALKTLSIVKPDLIISEVNFENGPAGFDLYLWVRTNATLCDTPFLFFATKIDRETLIAGKRLGVDDFIFKPLDQEVVMASIIHCLSRRKKLLTLK